MKRAALAVLLISLLIVEACLCAAFLPMSWQNWIFKNFSLQKHDQTDITHPDLAGEIDRTLGRHAGLNAVFYVITLLLLAGNTYLVRRIWRSLRRVRNAEPMRH